MVSILRPSVLLALVSVVYLVTEGEAICCPWVMTTDVKCACDDGSLVHPWECCSEGGCNVFCCNCGGPCKKSSPNGTEEEEITDNRIAKRSVRHILGDSEIAAAARHFSNIDLDGDLGISVEEAARHVEGDRGRLAARARRPGWFAQIDRNADGVIQPSEFDADLDEESVALFSGRK